jgi:DNA-directed RNA polymerase alpha subunit
VPAEQRTPAARDLITLGDVATLSERELSAVRNVGPGTIASLKAALAECGLVLRQEATSDADAVG